MNRPEPDPRIASYIAELEVPGIPYISTSHWSLLKLYGAHGVSTVDGLVSDYFKRKGEYVAA